MDYTIDVSVIIPTFNNLSLFKRALNSIIDQRNVNFEVIIVDDSTNNDIEFFLSDIKDHRVKYFHNKPNLGAIKNWNYGLNMARGQFVILLHHDESFNDKYNYLATAISSLRERRADIVVSNIVVNQHDGSSRVAAFPLILRKIIFNRFLSILFALNIIGPVSCVIFKRELITNFDERLHWLVDVDWYYRIFKGRSVYFDKSLIVNSMHGHSDQITQNIDIALQNINDSEVIKNKYNNFPSVLIALWLLKNTQVLRRIFSKYSNFVWKKNSESNL